MAAEEDLSRLVGKETSEGDGGVGRGGGKPVGVAHAQTNKLAMVDIHA